MGKLSFKDSESQKYLTTQKYQEYLTRQQEKIAVNQAKLRALQNLGLELLVEVPPQDTPDEPPEEVRLITTDYSLANKVSLKININSPSSVEFSCELQTPAGTIIIYCDDKSSGDHRNVEQIIGDDDYYSLGTAYYLTLAKKEIEPLISHYQKKGVKEGVLSDLREQWSKLELERTVPNLLNPMKYHEEKEALWFDDVTNF